jgi:hypothetical protein
MPKPKRKAADTDGAFRGWGLNPCHPDGDGTPLKEELVPNARAEAVPLDHIPLKVPVLDIAGASGILRGIVPLVHVHLALLVRALIPLLTRGILMPGSRAATHRLAGGRLGLGYAKHLEKVGLIHIPP